MGKETTTPIVRSSRALHGCESSLTVHTVYIPPATLKAKTPALNHNSRGLHH